MKISNSSRVLALLTAGVLSASVLLQPAPARADKAKNYKYGAIALGVVGGYLLSKGKTLPGAAVLGAGAYAYKKGEDTRKAEKYDNRYGYNNGYDYNNGDRYDDRYNTGYDYNGGYNVPNRNRVGNRDNNRNSDYRADNGYRNDNYRDASRRGHKPSNDKIRVR